MSDFATFDARLVPRIRGLLTLFELSTVTDGTNADLDDIREWGFLAAGVVPASGVTLVESDIAAIDAPTFRKALDLSEYRALASAFNNWTEVTIRVSQGQINESDLRNSWANRLAQLEAMPHIQAAIGVNSVTGSEVVLDDFIEADPYTAWGPCP